MSALLCFNSAILRSLASWSMSFHSVAFASSLRSLSPGSTVILSSFFLALLSGVCLALFFGTLLGGASSPLAASLDTESEKVRVLRLGFGSGGSSSPVNFSGLICSRSSFRAGSADSDGSDRGQASADFMGPVLGVGISASFSALFLSALFLLCLLDLVDLSLLSSSLFGFPVDGIYSGGGILL